MQNKDRIIHEIYYDPAGYGSIQQTYKDASKIQQSSIKMLLTGLKIILIEKHNLKVIIVLLHNFPNKNIK